MDCKFLIFNCVKQWICNQNKHIHSYFFPLFCLPFKSINTILLSRSVKTWLYSCITSSTHEEEPVLIIRSADTFLSPDQTGVIDEDTRRMEDPRGGDSDLAPNSRVTHARVKGTARRPGNYILSHSTVTYGLERKMEAWPRWIGWRGKSQYPEHGTQ